VLWQGVLACANGYFLWRRYQVNLSLDAQAQDTKKQ
jgi:hypothetical protein